MVDWFEVDTMSAEELKVFCDLMTTAIMYTEHIKKPMNTPEGKVAMMCFRALERGDYLLANWRKDEAYRNGTY